MEHFLYMILHRLKWCMLMNKHQEIHVNHNIVYKAALPVKNKKGIFTSIMARDKAAVYYEMGKTTSSTTPLFCFKTLREAQWYAGTSYPILEGYSCHAPINIRDNFGYILDSRYTTNIDTIQEFWKHAHPGMPSYETWDIAEEWIWGIYDFTPTLLRRKLSQREYDAICRKGINEE